MARYGGPAVARTGGDVGHHRRVGRGAGYRIQICDRGTPHRRPIVVAGGDFEIGAAFPAAIDRAQQLFTALCTSDFHAAIIFVSSDRVKLPPPLLPVVLKNAVRQENKRT